jgi:cell shape-determining protein MreD
MTSIYLQSFVIGVGCFVWGQISDVAAFNVAGVALIVFAISGASASD